MSPSHGIKLALIGASRIAEKVLPAIRSVTDIDVVGVAAARPDAAKAFALKNKVTKHFDSYDAALADPSVTAVYISTMNRDHASCIHKALSAGKHVLCEKPLVPTANEARNLFQQAREQRLVLLEGFMYRYHPQVRRLKDIIAKGEIGSIRSIRANFSFLLYDLDPTQRPLRSTSEALGGALMDIGCYGVDFVNSIVPAADSVRKVQVTRRADSLDKGLDLSTTALIEFQSGIIATIECSVDTPGLNNWEVSGTKGSVAALRFDSQGTSDVPLYFVNEDSEGTLLHAPSINTFEPEFKNFADAILGREAPHISTEDSIRNAELIQAIRSFR